jgi:predicted nuclease of predicted toxin-antitoxin system
LAEIGFQFDEHVPTAVAEALRRRGIDAVTTAEAGLLGASDVEQLRQAAANGRVLVTHDPDYLRLHQRGFSHAGIAYCRQGARSVGQLVAGLVLIYDTLDTSMMNGRVEFL